MSDKIKVTISDEEYALEIKRCYLPVKITQPCPECGREVVRDLGEDYLSYPSVGVAEDLWMYCRGCSHEWELFIKLGLTVDVLEGV
ncbi:MAG: hypothetical protein P1V36_00315 [Planctomycetota bacterium]|nr:hypothetical protein [Planctomycetota bacterium]